MHENVFFTENGKPDHKKMSVSILKVCVVSDRATKPSSNIGPFSDFLNLNMIENRQLKLIFKHTLSYFDHSFQIILRLHFLLFCKFSWL